MAQDVLTNPQPDLTCFDFRSGLSVFDVERDQVDEMFSRVPKNSNSFVRGTVEEVTARNAMNLAAFSRKNFERFRERPEWRTFEIACQRRYRDKLNSTTFDFLLADMSYEVGIDYLHRPLAEFADAVSPNPVSNRAPSDPANPDDDILNAPPPRSVDDQLPQSDGALESELVTIREILTFASARNVSADSVGRLIRTKQIAPVNPGRSGRESYLFDYRTLRPYLKERFQNVTWPTTWTPPKAP